MLAWGLVLFVLGLKNTIHLKGELGCNPVYLWFKGVEFWVLGMWKPYGDQKVFFLSETAHTGLAAAPARGPLAWPVKW